MGTIAEKLTYLSDTKDKLKESINNIGGSITNETTFRAYAEELDNIYSNIPKTAYQEGSNLSFSSIKGKVDVDRIEGDTTQDTYEGYNLLDISNVDISVEKATYTTTDTGYTIVTNSQASESAYGRIVIATSFVNSSEEFAMSFDVTSNVAGKIIAGWVGAGKLVQQNISANTKTHIFTHFTGISTTAFSLGIYAPNTTLKVENLMIYKGTTQKDYEPYTNGASPNPTYPQDIEVVTGEQEVVVQSANYFKPQLKVNGTDITQVRCAVTLQDDEFTFVASGNDMYLGNVGTSGTSYGNNRGTLIKLPTNASKVYVTTTNTDFNANYICWYDENKTTLGFVLSNSAGNNIPSGAKYTNVRIGKADSVSGTTYKTKVMVRIDDSTTSYVEHQEQNYTINLGDIELAKIGTYQDRIFETSGKNLFNNSVERKSAYPVAIDSSIGQAVSYNNSSATYSYVNCAYVEQGKTYTISWTQSTTPASTNTRIGVILDSNNIVLAVQNTWLNSATSITINPSVSGYLVLATDINATNIMINKGSTALPYEPYGSGKWYIEKNIGKVVLNGSQTITLNTSGTRRFNATYSTLGLTNIKSGSTAMDTQTNYRMCDHFRYEANNSNWGMYYLHSGWLVLLDSGSVIASADALKTWFASNNTTILYVQETPTYEEITNETLIAELNEIKKMMSYNGQTNINISGNLPMLLKARTLKGE